MAKYDIPAGMRDVDTTNDPGLFIRFLDAAHSMDFFQRVKADMLALLEVKPGGSYLDLGSAAGNDVRTLARLAGPGGRAVGVDHSEKMIAEARQRSEGLDLPGEFFLGDAYHLDFADNSFDGCRADRTLVHLAEPEAALAELVRVARPGARVVVCETDSGTRVLDLPNQEVTRKILDVSYASYGSVFIGRRLPRLFRDAGLEEIAVIPHTRIQTEHAPEKPGYWRPALDRAIAAGAITPAEGEQWWDELEDAVRQNRFFYATTSFIVAGRKPAKPVAS